MILLFFQTDDQLSQNHLQNKHPFSKCHLFHCLISLTHVTPFLNFLFCSIDLMFCGYNRALWLYRMFWYLVGLLSPLCVAHWFQLVSFPKHYGRILSRIALNLQIDLGQVQHLHNFGFSQRILIFKNSCITLGHIILFISFSALVIILHCCVINWFPGLLSASLSRINAEFPRPGTEHRTQQVLRKYQFND